MKNQKGWRRLYEKEKALEKEKYFEQVHCLYLAIESKVEIGLCANHFKFFTL